MPTGPVAVPTMPTPLSTKQPKEVRRIFAVINPNSAQNPDSNSKELMEKCIIKIPKARTMPPYPKDGQTAFYESSPYACSLLVKFL